MNRKTKIAELVAAGKWNADAGQKLLDLTDEEFDATLSVLANVPKANAAPTGREEVIALFPDTADREIVTNAFAAAATARKTLTDKILACKANSLTVEQLNSKTLGELQALEKLVDAVPKENATQLGGVGGSGAKKITGISVPGPFKVEEQK